MFLKKYILNCFFIMLFYQLILHEINHDESVYLNLEMTCLSPIVYLPIANKNNMRISMQFHGLHSIYTIDNFQPLEANHSILK